MINVGKEITDMQTQFIEQIRMGSKEFSAAVRLATRPLIIKSICNRLLAHMTKAAKNLGWAVTSHGSFTRDLDVVAVPWTDEAVTRDIFIETMRQVMELALSGKAYVSEPEVKPHGRASVIIHSSSESLFHDEKGVHPYIDLSIMDNRT